MPTQSMLQVSQVHDPAEWDRQIEPLPGAHALQTWAWGQVKSRFGWAPFPMIWHDSTGLVRAAALVLCRRFSLPVLGPLQMSVLYAPRGPLLDWSDQALVERVLADLQDFSRAQGGIFIKIDPDLPIGYHLPGSPQAADHAVGLSVQHNLVVDGWRFSDEQIQFRNTVTIDLTGDEETLLLEIKSKTRYNIRLAERRGVTLRAGGVEDIDLLYRMYAHTAVRDDFVIRGKDYYQAVWQTFFSAGLAEPLIAEVEGQPVGAVVIFIFAGRAWYMHGMSLDDHREKMFNHRLQWAAMLRAKAAGCHTYDMWGAPDTFDESDPLWGVYRFKEGFGGQVVRTLGAWDYPLKPLFYKLYCQLLPRLLNLMRVRGKEATRRSVST